MIFTGGGPGLCLYLGGDNNKQTGEQALHDWIL